MGNSETAVTRIGFAQRWRQRRGLTNLENPQPSTAPLTARSKSQRGRIRTQRGKAQAATALILGKIALAAHDKAFGRDRAWTTNSARVTADTLGALGRADEHYPATSSVQFRFKLALSISLTACSDALCASSWYATVGPRSTQGSLKLKRCLV
jgi:hypothetical protein